MVVSKLKLTKRFGARYGLKPKRRVEEVERMYRHRFYKCPKCGSWSLKRKAAGIWVCKKCGFKVAGGAYRVV